MPVLDMLCRDPRITRITLIEPDIYKPHNVERHLFPARAVESSKAELARDWLKERRPDLDVEILVHNIMAPAAQTVISKAIEAADIGVCAADNEPAKYHWDTLMRRHGKPWTLGEVLSGGIGGFVHYFVPGGPCYGCVASFLQRSITTEKPAAANYSAPGGPVEETTVPAPIASIHAIAALHALVTLELLEKPAAYDPAFTSLLFSLKKVPGVFEEQFRPFRLRVSRASECLICRPAAATSDSPEDLDVALNQALARLGDA
jgi:molybdopterin/thiamine biosynthesis adenylyltransferase